MIVNLNEKEYRVLKRVLGEAKDAEENTEYKSIRQWKDLAEIKKKGFPRRLIEFYASVSAFAKKLKYNAYFPLKEEIIQRFVEAYRYNEDSTIRSVGTSKNTHSTVEMETVIHPDGTFDINFSLENEEYNFETKRDFDEITVAGRYSLMYVINSLSKFSPTWKDRDEE